MPLLYKYRNELRDTAFGEERTLEIFGVSRTCFCFKSLQLPSNPFGFQAADVIRKASALKGSILGVSNVSIESCFAFTSWSHNFCMSLRTHRNQTCWASLEHEKKLNRSASQNQTSTPHVLRLSLATCLDVNMNLFAKKFSPEQVRTASRNHACMRSQKRFKNE